MSSADPQFDAAVQKLKDELHRRRESTTLLRRPVATLWHFAKVVSAYSRRGVAYLAARETLLYALLLGGVLLTGLITIPGPHQAAVLAVTSFVGFAAYWVGLGVLSSIGLGTGLHTFLLYTGPFIMKTAFAGATCGNLAFDTAGPNAFKCVAGAAKYDVGVLDVAQKVALVACLWGAGTAIGELPPYFVSRAAAQSGKKLAELEEVEDDEQKAQPTAMDRVKLQIFHALQKWGFWAIVACASVPNPLFDLAGITCGHFGVPFWTFFGATFIGKAIIKMSLQSTVVILIADPNRLKAIAAFVESFIPSFVAGPGFITRWLEGQRAQYLGTATAAAAESSRGLAVVWDVFLILMIGYFVVSIIHSSVQERLALKDQAAVDKYKAEYYLKRDANGGATPIASPVATPVASPAVSRASSRTASPVAPKSRSPSGAAAAASPAAGAAAPAPAAAAASAAPAVAAAADEPTAAAAAAGAAEEDAAPRASRRTSSAVKRQGSAAKLTRGKSKSKVTEEDDAAVAASFTPQRLTRSASRTTRSSSRKLT